MSLLVCSGCSTRYAPGLDACPHCGGQEHVEEGSRQGPTLLPSLDVACVNPVCPAAGVRRRVMLRCPVPGVVEVPASLRCARCGHEVWTSDQPGLSEEETMPKITRHGGATNLNAMAGSAEGAARPSPEPGGEGEQPSAGSSSSTSAAKPKNSAATRKPAPRRRARTTASPSSPAPEASSTAPSTDGSGEADPAS